MKPSHIQIKKTTTNDIWEIIRVEEQAFGSEKEAQLTADLLNDPTAGPIVSLLAFHENKAIGHILFTRLYMNKLASNQPIFHILAPLAVIPEYQKQGIGGLLIKEGLKSLKEMNSEMVFVLGHMDYYPRYGFIPDAKKLGYEAPFPIPEKFANAWMVQSLNRNGFTIEHGKVICSEALNKEEHWRE